MPPLQGLKSEGTGILQRCRSRRSYDHGSLRQAGRLCRFQTFRGYTFIYDALNLLHVDVAATGPQHDRFAAAVHRAFHLRAFRFALDLHR